MKETINLRQKRFIELYIASGNATEAYTQSGFRAKHVNRAAHVLLNKPYIQAELDKIRQKISNTAQLTIKYKLGVLHKGIEHYIATSEFDKAGKLIEISNKMLGHNAPDKTISTVTINNELMTLKQLTEEYLNDYQEKHAYSH